MREDFVTGLDHDEVVPALAESAQHNQRHTGARLLTEIGKRTPVRSRPQLKPLRVVGEFRREHALHGGQIDVRRDLLRRDGVTVVLGDHRQRGGAALVGCLGEKRYRAVTRDGGAAGQEQREEERAHLADSKQDVAHHTGADAGGDFLEHERFVRAQLLNVSRMIHAQFQPPIAEGKRP